MEPLHELHKVVAINYFWKQRSTLAENVSYLQIYTLNYNKTRTIGSWIYPLF